MSKRQKPFLIHNKIEVYRALKGRDEQTYCYALKPNCQAEGVWQETFDLRALPAQYRRGLVVEYRKVDVSGGAFDWNAHAEERSAHMEVICRAIDDGYNLLGPPGGSILWRCKKFLSRRFYGN